MKYRIMIESNGLSLRNGPFRPHPDGPFATEEEARERVRQLDLDRWAGVSAWRIDPVADDDDA